MQFYVTYEICTKITEKKKGPFGLTQLYETFEIYETYEILSFKMYETFEIKNLVLTKRSRFIKIRNKIWPFLR